MGRKLDKVSYQQAQAMMVSARNGERKLALNTYLFLMPNNVDYGVRLYDTTIILIHPDGTYTLNSGGYRTVTTKDRMNGIAGASVFQHKHKWYYGDLSNKYADGIIVGSKGQLIGQMVK